MRCCTETGRGWPTAILADAEAGAVWAWQPSDAIVAAKTRGARRRRLNTVLLSQRHGYRRGAGITAVRVAQRCRCAARLEAAA